MNVTKTRPPKEMLCQCCNSEYDLTLEDVLSMSDQIKTTNSDFFKVKVKYPCPVCGDQHGFIPSELPKEWMWALLGKVKATASSHP